MARRKQDAPEPLPMFTPQMAERVEMEARLITLEARVLDLEERHERDVRQIERRIGRVRSEAGPPPHGRVELSTTDGGSLPRPP